MPEAVEARLVPGLLQPREVAELRVEGEIEGCDPLLSGLRFALVGGRFEGVVDVDGIIRREVGESPIRQTGGELDRFIAPASMDVVSAPKREDVGMNETHVRATNAATPSVSVYFFSGLRGVLSAIPMHPDIRKRELTTREDMRQTCRCRHTKKPGCSRRRSASLRASSGSSRAASRCALR